MIEIYIKGNVPSSKNSKQWTGTHLINSKTVNKYLNKYEKQYIYLREIFIEELKNKKLPYIIGFYFIRDSKRKFDYCNVIQIVQDLMVKHKWIEDDNASILKPYFIGYEINKEKAGVIIKVLNGEN